MAWFFEIEADCVGKDAAEAFGSHFSGIRYVLPDGRECNIGPNEIRCFEDAAHHFRCCIVPTGASLTGNKDVLKSDEERSQFALFLYERLRTAPPFRFTVVGFELYDFEPFDPNGALEVLDGFVVSEQMLNEAGQPSGFEPFSPGYFWIPITEKTRL